jgi:hypothetical protein
MRDRHQREGGKNAVGCLVSLQGLVSQGQRDDGDKPATDGAEGVSLWLVSNTRTRHEGDKISFRQNADERIVVHDRETSDLSLGHETRCIGE